MSYPHFFRSLDAEEEKRWSLSFCALLGCRFCGSERPKAPCETRGLRHRAFQLKLKKLQFLYFIGIRDYPGKTEIFGEFFGTFFCACEGPSLR